MTKALNRRYFLRAAGVTMALPLLESNGTLAAASSAPPPRRMLAMCFALGLHAKNLFPTQTGRDFEQTPYLAQFGKHIPGQYTIVSGSSHPEVTRGHSSDNSFLTGARGPGEPGFRNSVSLDQYMVEKLNPDTRFKYLTLATNNSTISFSRSGVPIPNEGKPSAVFSKLFVNGTAEQVEAQVRRLKDGQSVMDAVLAPARRLQANVSAPDRERLDQYFSAVREVEQRLVNGQDWVRKPKPHVEYAPPKDEPGDSVTRLQIMLDLVALAFQTDSTRIVTLFNGGIGSPAPIPGVSLEYHDLSHHGQDPEKLRQLALIETRQMQTIGDFLGKLKATQENGETLFDRTTTLVGAAMGNASGHTCSNLPILLAGGGFRHGGHLGFDKKNNIPLCRLYVSMLQRMGIETDQFATGQGTLPGLDLA